MLFNSTLTFSQCDWWVMSHFSDYCCMSPLLLQRKHDRTVSAMLFARLDALSRCANGLSAPHDDR